MIPLRGWFTEYLFSDFISAVVRCISYKPMIFWLITIWLNFDED
ncbi:hypothetical protein DOT_5584 [Desulfosporosinus sp. OT]|nr:hypothetical protein DOT_5584 [Desulfosporosinus sp. OT]